MLKLDATELADRIRSVQNDTGAGLYESKRIAIRQMLASRAKDAKTVEDLRDIVDYVIAYML